MNTRGALDSFLYLYCRSGEQKKYKDAYLLNKEVITDTNYSNL